MLKEKKFIEEIKNEIAENNIIRADYLLHRILINKEFLNFYGNKEIPALWECISSISVREEYEGISVTSALVDLSKGYVIINPNFIINKLESFQDLLFVIMHERDHRLLRRVYNINWERLNKILEYNKEWISKVQNVVEDAWINASIRTELGVFSTLPEKFYCWSQGDPDFDPINHKIGEPRSEEYAILTCLSNFVHRDLKYPHEGLYVDAKNLQISFGIINKFTRKGYKKAWAHHHKSYKNMLSFPEWYELFCDWLEENKDNISTTNAANENKEKECPKHPNGKKGHKDSSETENKECACGDSNLFSKPKTLKEKLADLPVLVESFDKLKKEHKEEIFKKYYGKMPAYGERLERIEVVPEEVQNLSELDRKLLELGNSALTESWKTNTVQIKGAVKQIADELVQKIATMRVTEQKIVRPSFEIPKRPSKKDLFSLNSGNFPVIWDTPQYIEQKELVVYTDVSGSMNNWYSVALYITNQLKEFGCELYQFSGVVVKPVPVEDDNFFISTRGTNFLAVAEHIVQNNFKAVVIITDNMDSLEDHRNKNKKKWIEELKAIPELYALFLLKGSRPSETNWDSYFNRLGMGENGWQKCTDNITAIFDKEI